MKSVCCKIVWKELNPSLIHEISLLSKYGRMQIEIPSQFVCGSRGACLDCVFPGVQSTTGLEFFCVQFIYVIVKIVTLCFKRPSLFVQL